MVNLGVLHYIYAAMTIIIVITLLKKKEIVFPCIVGIFLLGIASSGSIMKGIQILYNSLMASGIELFTIIVVIALVVSMSKSLTAIGADEVMIRPIKKIVKSSKAAYFVLGLVMFVTSWFIWPSPAVALVGAIMLPVAIEVGLPAIWAAVAMNLFGHGFAFSGDFVIQGAPQITSKSAGIAVTEMMSGKALILWVVMGCTVILVSFIMLLREMRKEPSNFVADRTMNQISKQKIKTTKFTYFIAVFTPAVFIVDVVLMVKFNIIGGDATALIGGTAILIMCLITICTKKVSEAFENVTENIRHGFIFSIKIFAPVIVIAAFFFMGNGEFAQKVLSPNAPSILTDLGMALSQKISMSRASVGIIQTIVATITGLDGSGFSGLPLAGSLAKTFAVAGGFNTSVIASLGQIITMYVGGGTIIPWGVIPVAAICNVKAADLARKNLIPVAIGIAVTTIIAIMIM
ncbi:hypothetical protein [Inconstantimicrobium porci]|uniref:Transporter n=1 Tax=Inconstantimicrobium porci TaxID=2652291 RepID=A0A7X2N0W1_9CLOT|nr:hypothetical protein [Inconstantimicrobium porci]MDD6769716.1 hypothetical protein [Inconstantimicrobium porci]MSR92635.1 hypothetical protein [Inconstantimicrobium porci]